MERLRRIKDQSEEREKRERPAFKPELSSTTNLLCE